MVFRRIAAAIACSGLLLVTTQQSLHAQTTTGGIVGVVKDADGAAVPGATAKAVNTATNAEFTTVSGDTGQYVLRGLPVGPYTLTVELSGFQTFKRTDIVIRVNEESAHRPRARDRRDHRDRGHQRRGRLGRHHVPPRSRRSSISSASRACR